jgi:ABC-type bacteriocin/lantibiotic exporter with double-glycine peptidase domain
MNNSKDKFLQRMFLYRLQYLAAAIASIAIWYIVFILFCYLDYKSEANGVFRSFMERIFISAPILIFALFNTVTYIYSKYLANKYGIEMFADLDQEWLREHQAFDSKAFGEIFARLIQCRKIAGIYMLAVMTPLALINMYLAIAVGVIYIIAYFFYRMTYFDIAISYKVPRAMGGGDIVVSKIIDEEFTKKIDKLTQKLDQKK